MSRDFPFMLSLSKHSESFFSNLLGERGGNAVVIWHVYKRKAGGRLLFLVLAAVILFGCTPGFVPATGEKRYLGYTWEQEIQLGKQASQEIAQVFGVYRDPKLETYVIEVGNRILAVSHLRRPDAPPEFRQAPVSFTVLDSHVINAMALPGGYTYITRGMLAHLNNEDQLAAVLAHELGHVTGRHISRQAFKQQLGTGLLLGGAILGQQILGLPAEQILQLGGTAAQLIFLKYGREDELEADRLSIEYSSLAGYDGAEAIGLFRTLERVGEKEGQGLPSFLSTHPHPGDRIKQIQELAARTEPFKRIPDTTKRFMQAIEGLVVGEDPRQGFVEANMFYHPELRFGFPVPRGFRLINQPGQVVMIDAQKRGLLGFNISGEKSLQAAATKFLNQPGLRVLDRAAVRVNGLPAYTAVADAVLEGRQQVRALVYFIEHGGRVYRFLGYTAPADFAQYRTVFLQTMQGFRRVDDPRIVNREPVRLILEHVTKAGPFRSFLPAKLPPQFTPEEVATMNQVTLNQEIPAGTILKIPRAG